MALRGQQHRRAYRQGKRARLVDSGTVATQQTHAPSSASSASSSAYTDESDDDVQTPQKPARFAYRRTTRFPGGTRLRNLTGDRVLTPKPSNHLRTRRQDVSLPKGLPGNKSLFGNTRQTSAVPGREIHPLPHYGVRTRRAFRVHNDHRASASYARAPGRILRKRSRTEAQLDTPETETDDSEDDEPVALRHRQTSNVIDLTSTDEEEEELVTADEGHSQSSDLEPEPESDQDSGDPDAEYYLHHATSSQLNKLRKPTLVQLLTQLRINYPDSFEVDQDESDDDQVLQDLPKQTLLMSLLSAREHHARLSDSPSPTASRPQQQQHLSTPPRRTAATGMTRSTSLPTLPDATPGTTRTQTQLRGHRRAAKSISLSDASQLEEAQTSGSHTLRNGKVVQQLNTVQEVATPPQLPRLTRSTSRLLNDLTLEDDDDDDDQEENTQPTPVARRTRSARSSGEGSASSNPSSGHSQRRLRNGKTVTIIDEDEEAEAAVEHDDEDEDDDDETEHADDVQDDDASSTEEEQDEENEEALDVTTATANQLLRLRRPELVQLCDDRGLDSEGTKKDMVATLMSWRRKAAHHSKPLSDLASNVDSASEPELDSSGEETEHESTSAPKTVVARQSDRTRKARRETKTQALAQLDTTIPSKPSLPPLLLDPHKPKRRSRPEAVLVVDDDSEDEQQHRKEGSPNEEEKAQEDEASVALDLEKLKLQDKAISPDAIVKAEKIGSGGFKDVYRGTYRKIKVAICDIRGVMSDNEVKELALLRDLRHENVVKLVGVVTYDHVNDIPCSLVTELCLNGDLFDYLRRDAPAPPFERILKIMLDIASGLDYLHSRTPKIIHRDMKSSNVLITARGVAKITDFGLARVKNTTRSIIRSLVGTVNWQAPELWVPHPRYNEKVDCYAAGLVFWECLQWHQPVKKYPFEGMNEHAIYQEVGQRQLRPSTAGMGRHWGAEILDLVNRLWSQSPADRPSMKQAIEELQVMRRAARK